MKRRIPIDELRCPKCRSKLAWTVHGGVGHVGTAHCLNGRNVTRMNNNKAAMCEWKGQYVVRLGDNEVYSVPELRSLDTTNEQLGARRGGIERVGSQAPATAAPRALRVAASTSELGPRARTCVAK